MSEQRSRSHAQGSLCAHAETPSLGLFRSSIWSYYRKQGRDLPWRRAREPYRILVSEIMLQQTQVDRVLKKYDEFLAAFPDFASLAAAPLRDVLKAWQGLGYNRRALALKRSAELAMRDYNGQLPDSAEELESFPGIGKATASAVCAFAFNRPVVFIETNIRTVFIHFFFSGRKEVKDAELLPLLEQSLDRENPREWYYALMDYGAMLKRTVGNLSRKSAHYHRQQPFKGSDRQLRGRMIRLLTERKRMGMKELAEQLGVPAAKARIILMQLEKDGLIKKTKSMVSIA
ncbi:MAG: winged helix-turn-helix transcriptional regulator [Candidatus Aenigmarchaeota archaeon]|nr:winged helix-turn-helix transcriptional regulator [Candidatus Aenigmarchaeota archaeon]